MQLYIQLLFRDKLRRIYVEIDHSSLPTEEVPRVPRDTLGKSWTKTKDEVSVLNGKVSSSIAYEPRFTHVVITEVTPEEAHDIGKSMFFHECFKLFFGFWEMDTVASEDDGSLRVGPGIQETFRERCLVGYFRGCPGLDVFGNLHRLYIHGDRQPHGSESPSGEVTVTRFKNLQGIPRVCEFHRILCNTLDTLHDVTIRTKISPDFTVKWTDVIVAMHLATYEENGNTILIRDETWGHCVCRATPGCHAADTRVVSVRGPPEGGVPSGLFTVCVCHIHLLTKRIIQVHSESTRDWKTCFDIFIYEKVCDIVWYFHYTLKELKL